MPLVDASPAFELVGAVDPSPEARAAFSSTHPQVPAYANLPPALETRPDAAVVAPPNHLHAEIAETLLRRGVSTFVEKPLCLTRAEYEQIAAAAEAGGAIVVPSAAARFRSDVEALRRLVVDGTVGAPRVLELSWIRGRGIPRPGSWFTRRESAGGGALVDLGWHLVDVAVDLVGSRPVATASAVLFSDFIGRDGWEAGWREDAEPAPAGDGSGVVEDGAACFFVADGVAVTLRVAWASHEPYDVTSIAVAGTSAAATLRTTFGFSPSRVERPSLRVSATGESSEVDFPRDEVGAEYARQLTALDAILRGEGDWRTAFAEAGVVVGTIERLYRAAACA